MIDTIGETRLTNKPHQGQGESVLVVDDDLEQRELASAILSNLGYQVATVSSGEDALRYLTENKADILLLDMIMDPGIDGLETYKRVRKRNMTQKAIIVSGFSDPDKVIEAQRLGIGAYVSKPYSMKKIGVSIRQVLDNP